MPVSAVVITKDEEKRISQCITALRQITDDIVVVDAFSSDSTPQRADKAGARVFQRSWEGYGKAKNFGNAQARHPWIISIDADEVISPSLASTIRATAFEEDCLYMVRIRINFCGRWLRFSEMKPIWKLRIFNRTKVQWNMREVHEMLDYPENSRIKKLKGWVDHYSYEDVQDLEDKTDRYAYLSALNLHHSGKNHGTLKRALAPAARFFRSYILHLGILEGRAGFLVSKMSYKLVQKRYAYLDALKNGST